MTNAVMDISSGSLTLEALAWARQVLSSAGIVSADKEAEILLCGKLGCSGISLYLEKNRRVDENIVSEFKASVKKRAGGYPLQYILGEAPFYGLMLDVREGVFIPRPETEVLVEEVIALVKKNRLVSPRILEIGAGSGNICVSLTKNIPECRILATDINPQALELTRQNALRHNVSERITLLEADIWPKALPKDFAQEKFDLIVSNPPYVLSADLSRLPADVKLEPVLALDGGADGADFYREIISNCGRFLKNQGWIALEFGDAQQPDLTAIFKVRGNFKNISFFTDLNKITRFTTAEFYNG